MIKHFNFLRSKEKNRDFINLLFGYHMYVEFSYSLEQTGFSSQKEDKLYFSPVGKVTSSFFSMHIMFRGIKDTLRSLTPALRALSFALWSNSGIGPGS